LQPSKYQNFAKSVTACPEQIHPFVIVEIYLKILKSTIMEKFMFIFQGGQRMNNQSPEEMQAHMGKWMAWIEKLNKAGQYVSGEPLLPGGKLVSGKNGNSVTDGPYTEGKEVVGISKECPGLEVGGSVQVREVMKIEVPA
jgi:hypothetical protein